MFKLLLLWGIGPVYLVANCALFAAAPGQGNTNAPPNTVSNLTSIAPAEIASRSESAITNLRAIQAESASDVIVGPIEEQLPMAEDEISARQEENTRILTHSASLELFGRLESAWEGLSEELAEWNRSLTRFAKQLQEGADRTAEIDKIWKIARDSQKQDEVPPELFQRIETVLAQAARARQQVQGQLARVLGLQSRVSELDGKVRESLSTIEQARQQIIRHLFVRNSPALWSRELRNTAPESLAIESQNSLARQVRELRSYFLRKRERFLLHGVIFVCLAAVLVVAQRKLRTLSRGQADLEKTARDLNAPVPSALLISLLISPWLYPQAPRLWWSILGGLALVPAILILRKLLEPRLMGILNVLAAFYLIDQLRIIAASQPVLWRLLFLVEMAAGFVFCSLALFRAKYRARDRTISSFEKILLASLRTASVLFGVVLLANIVGYGRLSSLVGNVLLSAGYLALALYAVITVADALLRVVLIASPVARLAMVRHHSVFLARWVSDTLQWIAAAVWGFYVLHRLALQHSIWGAFKTFANTRIGNGSLNLTILNLLLFIFVIWAAFLASRMLRFVLEEEVYPHVHLAPGLHYSISKTLHYVVLLLGFLVGLALLGFPLTKLTILAGAFGVGLGFGMQNIVSNFVSGIILLFERPVKVGDVIQLDSTEGVVERIGIRASIVRSVNGSEIIVPNAKLISDPVTNWTFSQRRRLLVIPIAVASETDPQKVIQLLTRVTSTHSQVEKDPPPQALVTGLNNGTANFELRAWTDQSEDWQQVRSDLFIAIKSSLTADGIQMK